MNNLRLYITNFQLRKNIEIAKFLLVQKSNKIEYQMQCNHFDNIVTFDNISTTLYCTTKIVVWSFVQSVCFTTILSINLHHLCIEEGQKTQNDLHNIF